MTLPQNKSRKRSCYSRMHKKGGSFLRPFSINHFIIIFILLVQYQKPPIESCYPTFFVSAGSVNFNQLNKNDESNEKLKKNIREGKSHEILSSQQTSSTETKALKLNQILIKAGKRGIGGGIPGAIAGVIQVLTLMWLRTIINYQYRYGTSFMGAIRTLFNEGGIPRFYRGLWFALVQAPLSRFASTAANDGVESLLASFQKTKDWGPGRGTVLASIAVGMFRIFLMPVDTCKNVLQVDSAEGLRNLMRKVRGGKINLLYSGKFHFPISSSLKKFSFVSII